MSWLPFTRPLGAPPRTRALSLARPTIVSVLDIGTSKMCCMVARLTPRGAPSLLPGRTHHVEVLGIGHGRSRGVKSGVIVDVEKAEAAIRHVVAAAERMAGVTVDSLVVNVSCGRIGSRSYRAEIEMGGREIEGSDIRAVLRNGAAEAASSPSRIVLHALPTGYRLDGESDIRDPRGMAAERLEVDMHMVDAEAAPARNLEIAVNRAHLSVEAMVATPFASGLAALVEDESQLGCACIDMGGGTTTVSVFLHGRFVWTDAVAIGGMHVTTDLARGLSTRLEDAERLKVLHACVGLPGQDGLGGGGLGGGGLGGGGRRDNDTISVPPMSDDERDLAQSVPRSALSAIVTPRIEETFELVRDRLIRSGFADAIGNRVVLTGGASALPGVARVAERLLSARARLGRPLGVSGMPQAAKGAAFSAATGLLIYPQVAGYEEFAQSAPNLRGRAAAAAGAPATAASATGTLARMGAWLKTI